VKPEAGPTSFQSLRATRFHTVKPSRSLPCAHMNKSSFNRVLRPRYRDLHLCATIQQYHYHV